MQETVSASVFCNLQSLHHSKETSTQRGRLKTGTQLVATGAISTREDQSPAFEASELIAPASISKVQLCKGGSDGRAPHKTAAAAEVQARLRHPALEGTETDVSLYKTGKYNPIRKRTVQEV